MANSVAGKKFNSWTKFAIVINAWVADYEKKVERGERAPKTFCDYRDTARRLEGYMGELTCGEAEDPGLCDEVLKEFRDDTTGSKRAKDGYSATKRAKTVLSHVSNFAVRNGGMTTNPTRSVETIDRAEPEDIRILEPEERGVFRRLLREWCEEKAKEPKLGPRAQAWLDLPDLADTMLATGSWPGEALALDGTDVVPPKRTVVIGFHLVRVQGVGLVWKPLRKARCEALNPIYPTWAAEMFARRKLAAGTGPLFPTWNWEWQDPSNVAKRFNVACEAIGFGWVSARIYPHTVGTHIVDQGGRVEDAASQLGNTKEMVEKHYWRKQVTNERAAALLETLLDAEPKIGESRGH